MNERGKEGRVGSPGCQGGLSHKSTWSFMAQLEERGPGTSRRGLQGAEIGFRRNDCTFSAHLNSSVKPDSIRILCPLLLPHPNIQSSPTKSCHFYFFK